MCYYYDFHPIELSLMIKVRCGSCGRLVTVNMRDKYCPLCRRRLIK